MNTHLDHLDHDEVEYADRIDHDHVDYTERSTPGLPKWATTGREVTVITQLRWTTVATEKRTVARADAHRITLDGGLTVQGHRSRREDQTIHMKVSAEWGDEDIWIVSPDWDGTFIHRTDMGDILASISTAA